VFEQRCDIPASNSRITWASYIGQKLNQASSNIYNEVTCPVHSTARPTEHEPIEGRESDRLAQPLPEPEREEPATLPENHLQNQLNDQVKNATLTFDLQLLKLSNIHKDEVALPRNVCIRQSSQRSSNPRSCSWETTAYHVLNK
jgi:hypothetical protein